MINKTEVTLFITINYKHYCLVINNDEPTAWISYSAYFHYPLFMLLSKQNVELFKPEQPVSVFMYHIHEMYKARIFNISINHTVFIWLSPPPIYYELTLFLCSKVICDYSLTIIPPLICQVVVGAFLISALTPPWHFSRAQRKASIFHDRIWCCLRKLADQVIYC